MITQTHIVSHLISKNNHHYKDAIKQIAHLHACGLMIEEQSLMQLFLEETYKSSFLISVNPIMN